MVTIRPQRAEDDDEVDRLLTVAFGDDGRVAALAKDLRRREDPGASLVAVDAKAHVCGHVQLSTSWIDARERVIAVLVLSPLAVVPSYQSQGIGSRLLGAAKAEATALGAPLLFLEGDPGYYSTRGWRPAGELGFTAPSVRIPGPAFQVATLTGYDAATMRGALVYNDTFWIHDCVGLRGAEPDRSTGVPIDADPA